MSADPRVPGFLGRILSGEQGEPTGTCFQIAPGILATAWHVIDSVRAGEQGQPVWVDPLAGGAAVPGRTVRIDPVHDLALVRIEGALPQSVEALAPTDSEPQRSPVIVTGVVELNDPAHTHRFLDASGTMEGGTTRDDQIPLGRMQSPSVLRGMSGAPVRRQGDGAVVGVVSARYNSADGWARDSVWLARIENLLPLLSGLAEPPVRRSAWTGDVIDLTLDVEKDQVRLTGAGIALSAAHPGESPLLRAAVDRWCRHRNHLAGSRQPAPASAEVEISETEHVGRLLASSFLPGSLATELAAALAAARSRRVPLRLGIRAAGELGHLPWETLWLPGEDRPVVLDGLVRLYRRTEAATVPPSAGPLRILVAISSPLQGREGPLDHERELRNVLKAVRGARAGRAEVRIVHFATTSAIREALRQWPAHVLHLSGHGGPGSFVFENDKGEARPLTARQFVDEAIPPGRMPPVVALAACHTDAATATGEPSFAARLLASGAAAVIATQTAITDIYATRAFARIYDLLASTADADAVAAVTEARTAVQRELARVDDRDHRLAELDEWAVLSLSAGSGSVPLLDPTSPQLDSSPPEARAGVLRRETGEVVGRRWEQRRYPDELRSPGVAGLVLHGLGGVGKTTLADELVARLTDADPTLVVAVVARQTSAEQFLDSLVDAYAGRLGPAHRPPWAGDAVLRALARAGDGDLTWRQRFAVLRDQVLPLAPTVVLVDNFEDNLAIDTTDAARPLADAELAALLAEFAATPGQGRLLFTTRYRFVLPNRAERALRFHALGPLSYAETLKLVWALPQLDRLDEAGIVQLWRAIGGHPRCLEYVDALLAKGQARFTDVLLRLVDTVADRLHRLGQPDDDIDRYLAEHESLDAALAEAAALAADDVLLDDLLAGLSHIPGAHRLLLGVSVYRVPVDKNALLYQIGEPDSSAGGTKEWFDNYLEIDRIAREAGFSVHDLDPARLSEPIRAKLAPYLAYRPKPRARTRFDLEKLISACAASSLITVTATGEDRLAFMHRWTASEIQRRQPATAWRQLVTAHHAAAAYWRWRELSWPQPLDGKIADLREAYHHTREAVRLGDPNARSGVAHIAHQLQDNLANRGRRAEALVYCQQAVDLKRMLASENQREHLVELTGYLIDLGNRLMDLGRLDEALAADTEAVKILRRIAPRDPDALNPRLAAATANLASRLSMSRRHEEALTAATETVKIYRRLAATDPSRFAPRLGGALNNLGIIRSELGHDETALDLCTEATTLLRDIVADDPAVIGPILATALTALSNHFCQMRRYDEGSAAAAEAVGLFRRLIEANSVFEPDLAKALGSLGVNRWNRGERQEALDAFVEAVSIYRRHVIATPQVFQPALADALHTLGDGLAECGRNDEALAATTEAVTLYRQLAAINPQKFQAMLTDALTSLDSQQLQRDRDGGATG
ncbi:CHAT domain-containing protein [Micromonospora sp. NPDC050686]|uniref:CHAT domain-containing protein n=1 Tax=Micromonospora sp. NPDC050686 TaxID=3154631 RepID=UPI003404ED7F